MDDREQLQREPTATQVFVPMMNCGGEISGDIQLNRIKDKAEEEQARDNT